MLDTGSLHLVNCVQYLKSQHHGSLIGHILEVNGRKIKIVMTLSTTRGDYFVSPKDWVGEVSITFIIDLALTFAISPSSPPDSDRISMTLRQTS